jgi:Flp pilus assembly pilin Flp
MKLMLLQFRILKDTRGQDLIEYALMAGFVAVAAGAIMRRFSAAPTPASS